MFRKDSQPRKVMLKFEMRQTLLEVETTTIFDMSVAVGLMGLTVVPWLPSPINASRN